MAITTAGARVRARRRRQLARHPSQLVVAGFAATILVGTGLLMLPVAREGEGHTDFLTALFHATSAVCVTGLVTVDTPNYWSTFGEVTLMALIQIGGLGVMTIASILGLMVFRRLGLRNRLTAAVEHTSTGLGDTRKVVLGVVGFSFAFEALVAIPLFLRFWLGYEQTPGQAAYNAVFHAISAFNNAGFALWSDSLMGFVTDPYVCLPIALAVICGGLGFPVWLELARDQSLRRIGLNTKFVLAGTGVLLVGGAVFFLGMEWSNPKTLAPLSFPEKLLASGFQSVMPRTAGFNTLDFSAMREGTLLGTDVLMLIGGSPAGTAGGIKVTTFLLLFFAIYAEVRGKPYVEAFDRRIDARAIRQALTVALLGVGLVMSGTIALLAVVDAPTAPVLFEAVSAFGTVGLSAGITADLPPIGQLIVIGLMFLGRIGPVTLVSSLALRDRGRLHRLPEGRPLIG